MPTMYNEITRISVIAILALIIGVGGGWFFTRSHYEPIILAKNAEIATIDKINLGLIENYGTCTLTARNQIIF